MQGETPPSAIGPDPHHPLVLLPDETWLRADPVHVRPDTRDQWLTGEYPFGQLAMMVLTSQRVAFVPPDLGWGFRLRADQSESLSALWPQHQHIARALGRVRAYELTAIVRFWSWRPEFAAPPALQIGPNDLVTFDLQIDEYPWGQQAPIGAIREHFVSVTAAWEAVRPRGSSHDDHP